MCEELPKWYRPRGYRHFDRPISFQQARDLVSAPSAVSKHAFWPFISYIKITPRYKQNLHKVVPKNRPIAYASHVDSHIFAFYSATLSEFYERALSLRGLQDSVLAYRRFSDKKSNIDFSTAAFSEIEKNAPCDTVAMDVESFFDKISHMRLKQLWAHLLGTSFIPSDHYAVFRAITSYTRIDRDRLARALGITIGDGHPTEPLCSATKFREVIAADASLLEHSESGIGIPQGSPISGLLANLYMLEFDTACDSFMSSLSGSYRRYSDDILLICPPGDGPKAEEFVCDQLRSIALTDAKDKTCRVTFERTDSGINSSRPLQYLGFLFDGQKRLVRSQTLARLHRKMIYAIKCAVRDAQRSARKGLPATVWRRALYERYSHLGKGRTYFSYYRRALNIMGDDALRRQHRRLWQRLHELLDDRSVLK